LAFRHLDLFEIMNMKKLKKGERGFSLVELVIVVALAGLVCTAITATAFQVFTFSTRLSNQMTAVRQVQQAGFWVSPDVMMAEPGKITYNASSEKFLVLGWTSYNTTEYEVDYILQNGVLSRQHYTKPASVPDYTTVVAEYISSASFVPYGSAYTLTVTATVGGQTETRVYEVRPRVGS
jgi:prepilin-type N-terminal cleavage/methylation domain-containing protein